MAQRNWVYLDSWCHGSYGYFDWTSWSPFPENCYYIFLASVKNEPGFYVLNTFS